MRLPALLRSRLLHPLAVALVCAAPALAQSPYTFTINQGASNFVWTGTSTLGAIVGNPSNTFQFAGTLQTNLTAVPTADFTAIEFTGGDAFTVPDIHGKIPNLFPFLPPLATIDVIGLHVTASAPPAPVAPGGAFTASVTITATAGVLNVTPLTGTPSSTPLAGSASTPTAVNGSVAVVGGPAINLVAPISTVFPFSDPTSGASGSITLTGTLDANYQLFSTVCPGDGTTVACPCANSGASGHGCRNSLFPNGGLLAATGFASVSADTLQLTATELSGNLALFLQSPVLTAANPIDDGLFCLGSPLLRLRNKVVAGGSSLYPEATDVITSVRGMIPPAGGVYHYQIYYRNASTTFCTAATSNRSNAVKVTWLP